MRRFGEQPASCTYQTSRVSFLTCICSFLNKKTCRVFRRCVLNLPWRQTFSSSVDLWLGARDGSDRVQLGFQRRAQSVCVINSLSLSSLQKLSASCHQCPYMDLCKLSFKSLKSLSLLLNSGYLFGFIDAFYTRTCHFIPLGFCKMPFPSRWCWTVNVMRVWTETASHSFV